MAVSVERVGGPQVARDGRLVSLEQAFRFSELNGDRVALILMTSPLVGAHSLFGRLPGTEVPAPERQRHLRDFSPAPGFRFAVHLHHAEQRLFRVRFSQPWRKTPYLAGEFLWILEDEARGCLLREEINTARALEQALEPLTGTRPSIRRWLFFRLGHPQVMRKLAASIGRLAAEASAAT